MRLTAEQVIEHARRNGLQCALDTPVARPEPQKAAAAPDEDRQTPDAFTGSEKLLHRDFAADMQRRGVHCVHARTDMESTIGLGLPDFHCLYTGVDGVTRAVAIEFKRAGGTLSPKQRACIAEMRRKQIPVLVAYTLRDAILFAREKLLC